MSKYLDRSSPKRMLDRCPWLNLLGVLPLHFKLLGLGGMVIGEWGSITIAFATVH